MALSKIIAEGVDLTDTFAFTGTVTGAGDVLDATTTVPSEGGAATTNLVQGLAKVWINFDGQNNTVLDSLNITSVLDNYAGQYRYSYVNSMSSYAYGFSNTAGGNGGSLGDDSFGSTGQFNSTFGTASSSFYARYKGHAGNNADASNASAKITGDLA